MGVLVQFVRTDVVQLVCECVFKSIISVEVNIKGEKKVLVSSAKKNHHVFFSCLLAVS